MTNFMNGFADELIKVSAADRKSEKRDSRSVVPLLVGAAGGAAAGGSLASHLLALEGTDKSFQRNLDKQRDRYYARKGKGKRVRPLFKELAHQSRRYKNWPKTVQRRGRVAGGLAGAGLAALVARALG